MNFHETDLRKQFFTLHIPQMIEALREIAATLKRPAIVNRPPDLAEQENDILSDIYNFEYMPESQTYRKNDPLNRKVQETMNALLESLSPEQKELFLQYEAAENARGGSISCCAYKDGVRLAVQIIMAGCTIPAQTQKETSV